MLHRFSEILEKKWVRNTLNFVLLFVAGALALRPLDALIFATMVSLAVYFRRKKRERKEKEAVKHSELEPHA